MSDPATSPGRANDVGLLGLGVLVGVLATIWLGAETSSLLSGDPTPSLTRLDITQLLRRPGDPGAAWASPVGSAFAYWAMTGLAALALIAAVIVLLRLHRSGHRTGSDAAGLPSRRDIAIIAGAKSLVSRSAVLRPSLSGATASQLGFRLGTSRGVECWSSVEDSMVVLGPPRSGKGLHCVIPMILDAPGAVITTSTRPDNLAATITARARTGATAVFDPEGLAVGAASRVRWSPIRGCESPRVAIARATALCAQPVHGVEESSFWAQQARTAVRCLLHAAALAQLSALDLWGWSLSPDIAQDAVDILATHPDASPTWVTALDGLLCTDPRQRDSVWAVVGNVFAALADPNVLDTITPPPDEQFDPATFLADQGTLYLLGTASGASATATLVSAFVEDIIDTARRVAAAAPHARLDPPLSVILDEAANDPLPSLPALMSEGGGSGISTTVVLQSLSHARARWGHDYAAAIWDTATTKIILGGLANASDLRDISNLIGTRDQQATSSTRGSDGRTSTSVSTHEVPIFDIARIRTLAFGTALLLLRATRPIVLTQQPWTARSDAKHIKTSRTNVEHQLRAAAAQLGPTTPDETSPRTSSQTDAHPRTPAGQPRPLTQQP
ncbi:MAG: TraM recognition domain-containing protein [Actinomycetota bacterium]|nr:TraM recognition domain-containing protein [Actinomycetota bacterium]